MIFSPVPGLLPVLKRTARAHNRPGWREVSHRRIDWRSVLPDLQNSVRQPWSLAAGQPGRICRIGEADPDFHGSWGLLGELG
jgi:hypothetical protein